MIDESSPTRIYLSPPNVSGLEVEAVVRALESGWVAPLGPEVNGFEADVAKFCGARNAVALSSGTAAIHLGLKALGVTAGDTVVVPTMTFGATAFAVTYLDALPVFIDVETESWNLDPSLLREYLVKSAAAGHLPAAIVTVDVFGTPCNYAKILAVAAEFGIPVLADSAEALGATHQLGACGSLGDVSIVSFNGNKIMTTSGGGMLLTPDAEIAAKVHYWSAQSRTNAPWYEHEEVGYNYRMSNVLAALGRAQLTRLPAMISRRQQIRDLYTDLLRVVDGIHILRDPTWGASNAWLTIALFDPKRFPGAPQVVRETLEIANIEARPTWKPMHQQPVFSRAQCLLNGNADRLFSDGLCLPSGSKMTNDDVVRVTKAVLAALSSL